jgi:methionyl-tRNA formyltransferase
MEKRKPESPLFLLMIKLTGAMILSSEIDIDSNENAGHLHDRLMHLGSETVINTLELIEMEVIPLSRKMLQRLNRHLN